ncbi:hypothetical protein RKD24_004093 [Streptomyces calvus]
MRRTDRPVRRGTSLRTSDRTAGDSSPVTQNGRLRGRPEPAGGTPQERVEPTDRRRYPPAPLPGTDASLTSVLTREGPRGSARGALRLPPLACRPSPRGTATASPDGHLTGRPPPRRTDAAPPEGHRLDGRAPHRTATTSTDGRRPAGGPPPRRTGTSPDGHHLDGRTPPRRRTTASTDGHLTGRPPPRRTDAAPPEDHRPAGGAAALPDGRRLVGRAPSRRTAGAAGRPGLPDGRPQPPGGLRAARRGRFQRRVTTPHSPSSRAPVSSLLRS